jgi:predicted TIM-barrel fold metal-dependent hydrolase
MFGQWGRGRVDASLTTVLEMLRQAGVTGGIIGSLRAALYADAEGNREASEACAEHKGLAPAAALCLRKALHIDEEVATIKRSGARLLRLFREYEGWPIDYAPLEFTLRAAEANGLPVMLAALEPGDITKLGRLLSGAECRVIVTGVNTSHTPLVAESVVVGRDTPWMCFETSRLEGIDTLALMATELAAERLVFGTAMPFQYPSSAVRLVYDSGLSEAEMQAIFAGNILRLIGGS